MPEPITTTSYDANNRQLTFGDKTITYDDNGNLQSITVSNGTTLYQWNARNQLVGISGPYVNASFVYDGAGRREKKTINGSLAEFLYDGLNPVQETAGTTVLANVLPGLGIDEFLTRTDVSAGVTSNFLADALGSAIAVTDGSGTVQTEYNYEAFGRTTTTGTSNPSSYQYTGRENDGTGLYYYRARYYQPALQRFISEDPLGLAGGDIHLYGYVANSPLKYTDPLGLFRNPWEIFNDAMNDARQTGLPGAHNGAQDAYRHCLASCLMAKENGQGPAIAFGWANEKYGDWAHNQEQGERAMDNSNNACGRNFAKNKQDCKNSCLAAAQNGTLKTYQSGSSPGYWY